MTDLKSGWDYDEREAYEWCLRKAYGEFPDDYKARQDLVKELMQREWDPNWGC